MEEIDAKKEIERREAASSKSWLFRLLVLVGIGLLLAAWFLPWWNMDIEGFGYDQAQIRPWGLVISEKLSAYKIMMKGTELPGWFPAMMWAFLVICLVALMVGMFVRSRKFSLGKFKASLSQLLIGGVGAAFIIAWIFSAAYASWRMGESFGVALQGRTHIDFGDPFVTYVNTRLEAGWYLLFVTGLFLIMLAVFRARIAGEKQP